MREKAGMIYLFGKPKDKKWWMEIRRNGIH
jgi:hypothetical protein